MHVSRTAGCALAAALAATSLLAACGGGGGHSPRPASFIDVVPSLPADLDPAAGSGPAFEALESSLAATLVRQAPALGPTLSPPAHVLAGLARAWTRGRGGDWVFRLRAGVTSAAGHRLSARDVRFSIARAIARSPAARFLARLAKIDLADPVTVLGPASVRVNVTGRSDLALAVLAGFRFAVLDRRAVQAHATAADPAAHAWLARHLAFYGPYRATSFVPGVRMVLTARRPGPAFGNVAIEAAPAARLRLADVATRSASHTAGLDWRSFAAATRTANVTATLLPSSTVDVLVPDARAGALADGAVRRALSLAIDRPALARAAFAGFASPARHPQPESIPLPAGAGVPEYRHDPARARRLLARAGHPQGLRVTIGAAPSQGPGIRAELALLALQLRAAGFIVSTRTIRSLAELAHRERSGALGAVLVRTAAPIASVAYQVAACCVRGAPGNLGGYDSPALDALAGDTSTVAQRRALAILAAQDPQIPLVEVPSQNVTLAGIAGYGAYPVQATYYDLLRRH